MVKVNKIFKNIYFWAILIAVVWGFVTGFFVDLFKASGEVVYVEIDFGQRRRAFEGGVINDMSVLDALLASSRGGNFELRYAILDNKTDIFRINNQTDGLENKEWNFYLNGDKIETGQIHNTKIKVGDEIHIRFE